MMIKKSIASSGTPPQTVSTTKAGYQDWQPKLEAVGSLRAVNGADLSSEVAGIVADDFLRIRQPMSKKTRFWSNCAPMTISRKLHALEGQRASWPKST